MSATHHSRVSPNVGLLLLLAGTKSAMMVAAPALPAVSISCSEKMIGPYDRSSPDGGELESTKAFINWKTTGATALWTLEDSKLLPLNGTMLSFGPVVFVAVGPGGSVQKASGCELTSKRGPGRYGLIFSTKEVFNLNGESFKRQSIVQRVEKSQMSPNDLDARLSKILEMWGYTVGEGPTRDGTLVRYTPQYNDQPGLCDASCREVDIHKEVAFVLTIEILASAPRQWSYEFRVMPSVLMRYQREGGEFKPDPDGVQAAMPICRSLLSQIVK